jgi:cyanophycinase-like exopeptidase
LLFRAGAETVDFVRLARDIIDADSAGETLSRADVIFFSGGEVEDGMDWINKHRLAGLLKDLYLNGRQFIGISAGAIMIGSHWVKWRIPENDDTAELFDCLGLVPEIFDTHAEDEDWVELKAALRLRGEGALGYGLPRGGVISADSRGNLINIVNKYLTFIYKNGAFVVRERS